MVAMFLATETSFLEMVGKIIENFWPVFLQGLVITLLLSTLGTFFALFLALPLASMKLSKPVKNEPRFTIIRKKVFSFFSSFYITLFRGTPMILQGVIFFYGFYSLGIKWSPFVAGLTVVSLNTAAYIAEIIRGGITSIDPGQMEAARSLGFSYTKSMILVVFPQAIKNSIPAIINEFIVNIKDTAVLQVIGVVDIYSASVASGSHYAVFIESASIAAVIYLILTLSTTKIGAMIEKRLNTVSKPRPVFSVPEVKYEIND
jgi:putative lysine transport system permease protein